MWGGYWVLYCWVLYLQYIVYMVYSGILCRHCKSVRLRDEDVEHWRDSREVCRHEFGSCAGEMRRLHNYVFKKSAVHVERSNI